MIFYNPLDGDALTSKVYSYSRHCFLMTRLGSPVSKEVDDIRKEITFICDQFDYKVIDANTKVTGRDFLLKIWKLIVASPIAIGICHEQIPQSTQANIYYEVGVAQAMGKETLLVKSPKLDMPSDFVRTEYVEFNSQFEKAFTAYLASLEEQADHYELVADQLDRNPVLALDYLRRAFLITGDNRLREKAQNFLDVSGLENRAKNSVELLAGTF